PRLRDAVAPGDELATRRTSAGPADPTGVALRRLRRGRRALVHAALGGAGGPRLAALDDQVAGSDRAGYRQCGRVLCGSAARGGVRAVAGAGAVGTAGSRRGGRAAGPV